LQKVTPRKSRKRLEKLPFAHACSTEFEDFEPQSEIVSAPLAKAGEIRQPGEARKMTEWNEAAEKMFE